MSGLINLNDMITVETIPDLDVQPGHQVIVIADSLDGEALAGLLGGERAEFTPAGWRLPHDYETDRRLAALIDLLAHLRITAPQLLQLRLVDV